MTETIAFERLVAEHRNELYAHCYRMLGSVQDAEDALQEALLGAWRGLPAFEGRSSVRAWLYRICTNACLRVIERRPRRMLSTEYGPPRTDVHELGIPVEEPVFVEPWLGEPPAAQADPAVRYQQRESVELAFVAALQHLPGTQRAVLILREVLGFSAAETAAMLDTTTASVNSALQRARATVDDRIPDISQAAELDALGEDGRRELVDAFVSAWERADVEGIARLLADDARFTMPPLPAWFDGREAVMRFVAVRNFATPWRLVPLRTSGSPAFACYLSVDSGPFTLGGIILLLLRDGLVTEIASFLDPALHRHLGLPAHP
jgi:RNA polymerase sigma-70 factor (TIGR02960 family)